MGNGPILVTGATGTNGREIVQRLAALGAPTRALVRNPAKAASLQAPTVEIVEGDFDRPETLAAALNGVSTAFLLPPFSPDQVELSSRFIEAAKRAGTRHIVRLSALGADANSPMSLGRWHGEGEKLLEASGLAWTHLRPNGFMQNILANVASIAQQGAFYQPAADAKISHVDVRDIAAVAVKALTEPGHEGKIYEITGPQALDFYEIAAILSNVTGKAVTYVPVSPDDFRRSMLGYGLPEWMVDAMNELFEVYRAGYGATVTNAVQELTGKPAISYAQFAQDHAAAFQGG